LRALPGLVLAALLALAAGCAAPESQEAAAAKPVAAAKPATAPGESAPQPLACPPAPKPQCPAPGPAPVVEPRGRLDAAAWSELPNWGRESLRPSLDAFARSCAVLGERDPWMAACAAALALPAAASEADLAAFFESTFDVYRVVNPDDTTTGMVTGYYEPLLHGSRTRTHRYRYPIYAPPPDLLTIDLSSVYPELKHRRLRGRLEGNRVVPYYSRGDIDADPALLKGLEIAWVDDEIDDFFLHIQGSGQIQLPDGQRIRVGYADQNGQPFRSLGALLIRNGEIPPERASMQGIKGWAMRHRHKLQAYLDANPSYVFFRELPSTLPGPIGALGVPLTPERSIAVDARVVPLGAPVYLATTRPNTDEPLERLMVAQDTGGAIAGAVRADFFWGFGDEAGALAGKMRQAGRMWVLLPKGVKPADLAGG
jgi:membrane-bound lytic murein transglycosylase A